MHAVVPQASVRHPRAVRRGDRPAEHGRLTEPRIIDQHQQDVRSALRRHRIADAPVRRRITDRPAHRPSERRVGHRDFERSRPSGMLSSSIRGPPQLGLALSTVPPIIRSNPGAAPRLPAPVKPESQAASDERTTTFHHNSHQHSMSSPAMGGPVGAARVVSGGPTPVVPPPDNRRLTVVPGEGSSSAH